MIKEFEGKTEKEAIDIAVAELGLERGEFDVEIIETTKKTGLFRKGTVKIRVHAAEDDSGDQDSFPPSPAYPAAPRVAAPENKEGIARQG